MFSTFDRQLRTLAQAFAQPSRLGSLAHIVPRAIAAYGAERLKPGDGLLINDPCLGGVHFNDITLISPVFHEGESFGYLANIAHHVDVGGGAPGMEPSSLARSASGRQALTSAAGYKSHCPLRRRVARKPPIWGKCRRHRQLAFNWRWVASVSNCGTWVY